MGEPALSVVPPKPRGLVTKLSELLAVVERVPKSGHNKFHGYDFATESDIVAAVRLAMADRQLLMIPNVLEAKWELVETASGKKERLCTLKMEFELIDGESGESRKFTMYGQGQDAGDKSVYKATTGAEKYALLKLFLIPTGDDPETTTEATNKPPPPAGVEKLRQQVAKPAQTANEPPPHTDADAPHDSQTGEVTEAPPDGPCPNYGNAKGKRLSELDVRGLQFYASGCERTLADQAKSKFHDKERQTLALLQAWVTYRS